MPPPGFSTTASLWGREDRDQLAAFLQSTSGQRLLARMRNTEASCAILGAKDVLHPAHAAGRTVGYGEALEHLTSLSCSCHDLQENAIGAFGVTPANETTAQHEHQHREYAELLKRFSP